MAKITPIEISSRQLNVENDVHCKDFMELNANKQQLYVWKQRTLGDYKSRSVTHDDGTRTLTYVVLDYGKFPNAFKE